MSISFNVLEQGWIPVINNQGKTVLLGLRQIFAGAHNFREISDFSPLVEFSLYRFLGLFLMDALRPEDDDELEEIFQSGHFDMKCIEKYISLCESEGTSFDLFDPNRPFLQSRYDKKYDGDQKPVSVLDCTQPSGNNHVHFNHNAASEICPGIALKLMLTSYWFCTACAQGYPSGVYGVPPFFGVIKGRSLFETLVYLLLPVENIANFDTEPVLWRRTTQITAKNTVVRLSWLQGMLFPTRRICLVPDQRGIVVGVYFSQGEDFKNKDSWRDPYVTYIDGKDRLVPLCPDSKVPIWHNIYSIVDVPGKHASLLLNQYLKQSDHKEVDLTLYGVETNKAKYLSVYRCDLILPRILSFQWIVNLLKRYISVSQQFRVILDKTIKNITDVPDSASQTALTYFDDKSESSFKDLCTELETPGESAQALFNRYLSRVFNHALSAYDNVLRTLNLRAHALVEASVKLSWIYATKKKLVVDNKDNTL